MHRIQIKKECINLKQSGKYMYDLTKYIYPQKDAKIRICKKRTAEKSAVLFLRPETFNSKPQILRRKNFLEKILKLFQRIKINPKKTFRKRIFLVQQYTSFIRRTESTLIFMPEWGDGKCRDPTLRSRKTPLGFKIQHIDAFGIPYLL